MTGLSGDDAGQWILLSGIIIATGMVVLLILLNTAMLTGHSSVESVLSFPKNDIRDLRDESRQEASILAVHLNREPGTKMTRLTEFNRSYDIFISDMKTAYMSRGAVIDITYMPYAPGPAIDYVLINVTYDDGNTRYKESLSSFSA